MHLNILFIPHIFSFTVKWRKWHVPELSCLFFSAAGQILPLLDGDVFGLMFPTFNCCWQHRANSGCTCLSFNPTAFFFPIPSWLVIFAGKATIICPLRPVSPYNHPCRCNQGRLLSLAALFLHSGRHDFFLTCSFWHVLPLWLHLFWTGVMCVSFGSDLEICQDEVLPLGRGGMEGQCSDLWRPVRLVHLLWGKDSGFWSSNFQGLFL